MPVVESTEIFWSFILKVIKLSSVSTSVAVIAPTKISFSSILNVELEVMVGASSSISLILTVITWVVVFTPSDAVTVAEKLKSPLS